MRFLTPAIALILTAQIWAQPVRLVEKAPPGAEYRVVAVSTIAGELLIPSAKDKPPERVKVTGKSEIDYAEIILAVDPKEADHKSLRVYERIDFKKVTGDRTDETILRPAVRRLVMQKKGHAKVPFSPDGPLIWAEIDALRTDFMVPALAGLLPQNAVRPGDTWKATSAAVTELTDLEKVTSGDIVCTLEAVAVAGPRKIAQVSFAGTLHGINEDGPTRQKLTGKLAVDLGANCITFIKVEGEHYLLDGEKEVGKITGTYELQRAPTTGTTALADASLKGLELTPTEENTRLLYDSEEMGVRFIHSRNWRVVRSTGRQITVDESTGASLLITVDLPDKPTATARYLSEALKELKDRGGRVTNRTGPDRLAAGAERFTLDAEMGKESVTMDYMVIRQEGGGATLAARLPSGQREARMKELERLARSFAVTRRPEGK